MNQKRLMVRVISFIFIFCFAMGGTLLSTYFADMDYLDNDSAFTVTDPILDYPSTLRFTLSIQSDSKISVTFNGTVKIGNSSIPISFDFYGGIYFFSHPIDNIQQITSVSSNITINGALLKTNINKPYLKVAVQVNRVLPLFMNLSMWCLAEETFDYSFFLSLKTTLKIPISATSYAGYVNFTCIVYYIIDEWDCEQTEELFGIKLTPEKRLLGTINDIALYQSIMIFENLSKCYIETSDNISFALDARFALNDPLHPPTLCVENIVIDLIGNVTFIYDTKIALIRK